MKVILDRMLILESGIVVSNTLVCSLEVGISYIEFDTVYERWFYRVDVWTDLSPSSLIRTANFSILRLIVIVVCL